MREGPLQHKLQCCMAEVQVWLAGRNPNGSKYQATPFSACYWLNQSEAQPVMAICMKRGNVEPAYAGPLSSTGTCNTESCSTGDVAEKESVCVRV